MSHEHALPPLYEELSTLRRTPLFQSHVSGGARMVPFAGWEMPVQFSGILAEAKTVRSGAGIFDVSHMGRVEIEGGGAPPFLQRLVTADVSGMATGRARYTLLCNEDGGILDDAILYRLGEERFLMVPNAANAAIVEGWLEGWRREWGSDAAICWRTDETAMVALQGPRAEELLQPVCSLDLPSLRPFRCAEGRVSGAAATVARTGYTGEDGFEVIVPAANGPALWSGLLERGAVPCGLGARDVLRIEAGLPLHGSDMDATTTPLDVGLERFVKWDKDEFVGLPALKAEKARGISRALAGLRMEGRGIPRAGYPILDGRETVGRVTSGTYSPTIDAAIGLGSVAPEYARPGRALTVEIRDRRAEAEVVPLPFYSRKRRG